MMNMFEVTPDVITKFFIDNMKTAELGLPDEELKYLKVNKKYFVVGEAMFVGLGADEDSIICLIRWEYFTPIAIVIHVYVKSDLIGEKVELKKAMDFFFDYLINKTYVRKVQLFVAEPCVHVVKAAERYEFNKEGFVPNCIIWRGELKGLFLYGLDLRTD